MALTKISRSLLDTGVSDSSDATAITIDSSENVGIGTNNPSAMYAKDLVISAADEGGLSIVNLTGSDATNYIMFGDSTSGDARYAGYLMYEHDDNQFRMYATGYLNFYTANSERMRINSSGAVLIGQSSSAQPVVADIAGIGFSASGLAEFQVNGGTVMRVGRLTNDGDLVEFRAQTSVEGKISVSGAVVSYQGFSGSHESSGIATDTEIGTVCSTIDELDTYVSGNKSGQTRAEHAKIKVSDTVGDSRVYGVLSSYSETDNKPIVSSVGIGSVRVTGACNGGDLLESNGDGTAKVQDDDIIRSKTIGKVTIGNSNAGVKLVSCVLYCG